MLVVSTGPTAPYRRPLVAVDLEASSVDLLLLAARVTAGAASRMSVAHAFPIGFEGTRGLRRTGLNAAGERLRRSAERRLLEILSAMPGCGVEWRPEVVPGPPREVLPDLVGTTAADLVVVGTHAPQGLHRLLLGSVASDVLRSVACDVLVGRPDARVQAFPPRAALSPGLESA
jgi:nucleotide-binding universal stress UspA family protein